VVGVVAAAAAGDTDEFVIAAGYMIGGAVAVADDNADVRPGEPAVGSTVVVGAVEVLLHTHLGRVQQSQSPEEGDSDQKEAVAGGTVWVEQRKNLDEPAVAV
jgi:hypothetical protein